MPARQSLMTIMVRQAPEGALDLGMGEPLDPIPEPIMERLVDDMGRGSVGYGPPAGLLDLRELLAERYSTFTTKSVDDVVATPGVTHAIFVALTAALQGGHARVVYPNPGYVTYAPAIEQAGGVPVPLDLAESTGFAVDDAAVAELDRLTDEPTAAVIVNSPSNPTGQVMPEPILRAVADICGSRGIPVISDEIYEHLVFEGRHVTMADFTDNVFVCSGVSKLFSLTGFRSGWCIAPAALRDEALAAHQYSVFRTSIIGQRAAQYVLETPAAIAQYVSAVAARRRVLLDVLAAIPDTKFATPVGGFFGYLDVSRYGSDWDVAQRLLDGGLITTPSVGPGYGFGSQGRGYLRISYAPALPALEAGVARLKHLMDELSFSDAASRRSLSWTKQH